MKKMKLLISVIVIMISITSCKRSGFSKIEGLVLNDSSGIPIENIVVKITYGYGANGDYNYVGSTKTDANGHYQFSFYKRRALYHYYVSSEYKLGTKKIQAKLYFENRKSSVNLFLK